MQKKQQGGKKGKFIKYTCLSMADYLLPEAELTTEQKRQLFSVRSEMNENPFNYGEKIPCSFGCIEEQNNSHLLSCIITNKKKEILDYEDLLNGPLQLKIELFKKFKRNIIIREQLRDSVSTVNPL